MFAGDLKSVSIKIYRVRPAGKGHSTVRVVFRGEPVRRSEKLLSFPSLQTAASSFAIFSYSPVKFK